MVYPGGKNSVFRQIINQIPPHRVYIEPFAGSAAVWRNKRPAEVSYLIDLDPGPLGRLTDERSLLGGSADSGDSDDAPLPLRDPNGSFDDAASRYPRQISRAAPATLSNSTEPAGALVICADAREWLAAYPWRGDEFVYADPPYLLSTRLQQRQLYRCELSTEEEHAALLKILLALPCPVALSGYWSELYADRLTSWRSISYQTMTRSGTPATEYLWMNYPEPVRLHDYRYLGKNFRERQDFKRMRARWLAKLEKMPVLKRQALLSAIDETEKGKLQVG